MRMSYIERQAEWVKKHDVKVGDHVRLIRAASDGEDEWPNDWPRTANGWIGNILRVMSIGSLNILCYNPDADDWFGFPYFVLEKVVEHKDKEWEVSYGLKVKTGDPVLVRGEDDEWRYTLFSHAITGGNIQRPYRTIGLTFSLCIPYVGNEHLIGTKKDYKAPEEQKKPRFVFGAKVKATLSSGEEIEGVLIGFYMEDPDKPFEVAVRNEDADFGRVRYWAKEITYID